MSIFDYHRVDPKIGEDYKESGSFVIDVLSELSLLKSRLVYLKEEIERVRKNELACRSTVGRLRQDGLIIKNGKPVRSDEVFDILDEDKWCT